MLPAFLPVTALVLFLDSRLVAAHTPYGQHAAAALAFAYFLAILTALPTAHRLALTIFLGLAALGEVLFSLIFDLYDYRLGGIPLYVPLGHSILLGTALLCTEHPWVQRHLTPLKFALSLLHGGLLLGALLFLGDTLSILFTSVFVLLLRRRSTDPFFLILGVLVLYVELLGTTWGCWTWRPTAFGLLHTTNPPPGAFTCYAAGEMLALYCARISIAAYQKLTPKPLPA